jgi:hypothetical protein
MLSFCNNAGPAFIFGILSCLFPTKRPLFMLYCIHILSAIFVGTIIPSSQCKNASAQIRLPQMHINVIESAVKTMALISAWVIVFRIILSCIFESF